MAAQRKFWYSGAWWQVLLLSVALTFGGQTARASAMEDTLHLRKGMRELFIDAGYYSLLEDTTNALTLRQVRQLPWSQRFDAAPANGRAISHTASTYWMRVTIHNDKQAEQHWYLETFDSHIGYLTCFRPTAEGRYDSIQTGSDLPFASRQYPYKNFLFPLQLSPGQTQTYYLRFKSSSKTSFLSRLRTEQLLAAHTQTEYGLLGAFYGILFIMVVYNLCIYLFIGEQTYLRYVLYVLSCSLLFLSEDGLGFQFLWPRWPWLNTLVNEGSPLLLLLTFSYYARMFLDAPQHLPRYDRLTRRVVLGSAALVLLDIMVLESGLSFWLYLLPYGMIYYAAILIYRQGLRPARYFLLAHALVAASLLFLITRKLGISFFTNTFTVYSMNMALVLEVAVLSYALGDKIKGIKDATIRAQAKVVKQLRKRHQAQDELVEQLRQNQELKDQLNSELEALVTVRTHELNQQSETIVAQNRDLLHANGLLALQATAIEKLNQDLQRDLYQTQTARVLSKEVDFGEFSRIYPDKDACLIYLADLKWAKGYHCRKCGHEKFCDGREPHSRRCTRCRYVESATAYTLFQKCKFSIVKALYAVFLIHTHKGSYSSQELSRVLDLRQATCWSFMQKVLDAMQRRRLAPDYEEGEGWTHVILDDAMVGEEVPE